MATSLSLENDSSLAQGYIKVNGTTAATLTTSGITGNLTGNVTGSLTAGGSLTLATAQIASGTAVNFTGIPSWAKRITVMFNGVSITANSDIIVQIGSGSFATSGYEGSVAYISSASFGFTRSTTAILITNVITNPAFLSGNLTINNFSSNIWTFSSNVSRQNDGVMFVGAGISPNLSGSLDRIRITTVNGTDTFDAGTINISYEG